MIESAAVAFRFGVFKNAQNVTKNPLVDFYSPSFSTSEQSGRFMGEEILKENNSKTPPYGDKVQTTPYFGSGVLKWHNDLDDVSKELLPFLIVDNPIHESKKKLFHIWKIIN